MAYFYVKNSLGTRTTGGGTTKQTGSFTALGAANVYATIALAISDGAGSGDIICCSDAHDYDAGSTGIQYNGPVSGASVVIVSAADANCDTYSAGAIERTTASTVDVVLAGGLAFHGVNLSTIDLIQFGSGTGAQAGTAELHDLTIGTLGSWNYIGGYLAYGSTIRLQNVTIDYASTTALAFDLRDGLSIKMFGGGITSSAGGDGLVDQLTYAGFIAGGGSVEIIGADLSIVDGTLFNSVGSAQTIDDVIRIRVDGCKLHSSVNFFSETLVNEAHDVLITRSSSSSAAAEYQYYRAWKGGVVEDETGKYRDGSTAFPNSGQRVSLKCVTDTSAVPGSPFYFDFPSRYAELSVAGSDVLRLYILSSTALTDADVYAEAVYPDGTNKQTPNRVLSVSEAFNPLRTGTTLTTNTEAWTGRTTENRYQIDIDTSADAGADCVPIIRVYVAKASTTIYFCPTVEAS